MKFYDVTSWSYVNLDDPILKAIRAGVGWVWLARLVVVTNGSLVADGLPKSRG